MQDNEEDVIFENSALHDHLTRCGIDADVITRPLRVNHPFPPQIHTKPPWYHRIKKLLSCLMYILLSPFSLRALAPKGVCKNDLALHYLYRLQQSLRSSACLESEDVDFLDTYMGPLHLSKFKDIGVFSLSTRLWIASLLLILSYQIFIAFVSKNHNILFAISSLQIITIRPEYATYSILLRNNPVAMTSATLLALLLLKNLLQYLVTREFRGDVAKFEQLVQLIDQFQKLMSKAVSLIQETEVISRGYTIVSRGTPIDRIECNTLFSSQRQCPDLRREVFLIARATMLPLKFSTQKLIKNPASPDILGRRMNFLANIPLEQYGPCITLGHYPESLQDLLTITDNFSIASIKAMCQLCQLQQAEFIKVLILSSICDHGESNGAVKCLRKISKFIDEPLNILEDKVRDLNRAYTIDKANILSDKEPSALSPPQTRSELYSFYCSIHSLDLHMRHALQKVHEMAELIEEELDVGNTIDFTTKRDDWFNKLEDIRCYMTSCKNCYDECCTHLAHIRAVTVCIPESPPEPLNAERETRFTSTSKHSGPGYHEHSETVTKSAFTGEGSFEAYPPGSCDVTDPVDHGVSEDVFEGYVDNENISRHTYPSYEFTPQEKRELRKHKDHAVSVLHELKEVISGIDIDRKKRERNILKKKYGTCSRSPSRSPPRSKSPKVAATNPVASSHGSQRLSRRDRSSVRRRHPNKNMNWDPGSEESDGDWQVQDEGQADEGQADEGQADEGQGIIEEVDNLQEVSRNNGAEWSGMRTMNDSEDVDISAGDGDCDDFNENHDADSKLCSNDNRTGVEKMVDSSPGVLNNCESDVSYANNLPDSTYVESKGTKVIGNVTDAIHRGNAGIGLKRKEISCSNLRPTDLRNKHLEVHDHSHAIIPTNQPTLSKNNAETVPNCHHSSRDYETKLIDNVSPNSHEIENRGLTSNILQENEEEKMFFGDFNISQQRKTEDIVVAPPHKGHQRHCHKHSHVVLKPHEPFTVNRTHRENAAECKDKRSPQQFSIECRISADKKQEKLVESRHLKTSENRRNSENLSFSIVKTQKKQKSQNANSSRDRNQQPDYDENSRYCHEMPNSFFTTKNSTVTPTSQKQDNKSKCNQDVNLMSQSKDSYPQLKNKHLCLDDVPQLSRMNNSHSTASSSHSINSSGVYIVPTKGGKHTPSLGSFAGVSDDTNGRNSNRNDNRNQMQNVADVESTNVVSAQREAKLSIRKFDEVRDRSKGKIGTSNHHQRRWNGENLDEFTHYTDTTTDVDTSETEPWQVERRAMVNRGGTFFGALAQQAAALSMEFVRHRDAEDLFETTTSDGEDN